MLGLPYSSHRSLQRFFLIVLPILVPSLLIFTLLLRWTGHWGMPSLSRPYAPTSNSDPSINPHTPQGQECSKLRSLQDVVVTVKTGASEVEKRIPPIMTTSLRCAPQTLIFSDLQQQVEEYGIHDSLDDVSQEITEGNSIFDLYRFQQQLNGTDLTEFTTALKAEFLMQTA